MRGPSGASALRTFGALKATVIQLMSTLGSTHWSMRGVSAKDDGSPSENPGGSSSWAPITPVIACLEGDASFGTTQKTQESEQWHVVHSRTSRPPFHVQDCNQPRTTCSPSCQPLSLLGLHHPLQPRGPKLYFSVNIAARHGK